jgi:hypothetical protein
MNPIDADERILSEDTAGHANGEVDNLKFVPVAESIRYRKRAQSAERKIETLTEQLREAKSEAKKMAEQLSSIEIEQKLTSRLAAAGTVDLETAVLIAKAGIEGGDDADLDGVVKRLKREKQYLFVDNSDGAVTAKKTAGVKDRMQNSQTTLERAARRAATTGNRTDLHEYLKLRRNFI